MVANPLTNVYVSVMIYIIASIPFAAAISYNFAATKVRHGCLSTYNKEEAAAMGFKVPEGSKEVEMLDMAKAKKWLNIMVICYYPAWPLLRFQRLFR